MLNTASPEKMNRFERDQNAFDGAGHAGNSSEHSGQKGAKL